MSKSEADITILGHMVSQPTRAVVWALTIKKVPFKYVNVDPFKKQNATEEFLLQFPTGHIPAMIDSSVSPPLKITESHAMLVYLATKYGWRDWYPTDLPGRARVDQWLHWHHLEVRQATGGFFRPVMMATMGAMPPEKAVAVAAKTRKAFDTTLKVMKFGAFVDGATGKAKHDYLTGASPSIADIAAYCEFDQLEYLGLLDAAGVTKYPEVVEWMQRMKQLPAHDEVREPVARISGVVSPVVERFKSALSTKHEQQLM